MTQEARTTACGAVEEKARQRTFLVYPWLVSLYPVLALLGLNVGQVSLWAGIRPLAFSVLLMALAVPVGRLLFRDWGKAAAVATLGFVLFFSYGHIYTFIERINATGILIGRHRYLLPFWAGLFLIGAWRILRAKDVRRWAPVLNVIAGFALVIPIVQIGVYEARADTAAAQGRPASIESCTLRLPEGEPARDIYYIVLDGYMRDDVLLELTGYDNTPFLEELREIGFAVPRGSRSNYPWTDMSLSSSLNLNYLPALGWAELDQDWALARSFIVHNLLRRELECLGYSTVAFETGYYFTEWRDADHYLRPGLEYSDLSSATAGINQFEWMWINTSVGRALEDTDLAGAQWPPSGRGGPGLNKRERVLFDLEQLSAIASGSGPKLVFVHILSPHFPFVFGPHGERVFLFNEGGPPSARHPAQAERFWRAYADELVFLNRQILEAIRRILLRSSTPPIIVIQGDHGFVADPPEAKPPILNAYYLPGGEGELIYDGISPVNTFRLILSAYFGADYELLDDVSYCTLPHSNDINPEPCVWTGAQDASE